MADNVAVTEGSGKSVASDDVSGQQYQRIKLDLGTDGAAAPALAGAGAVATGVQRVTLASDDPAVALLGTIDTDTGVIAGDTTSIDGKITACNTGAVVLSSGTVTTVSTVTNLAQMGGAALAMNEGVLGVGVQRVSLATDDDAVAHLATIASDTTSIDGNITACNTGAVVLSSGTVTTVSTVTAVTSLDKGVYVDDAAWTGNTSSHYLVGGLYQSTPQTVTDGRVAPIEIDVNGKIIESNSATIASDTTSLDGKIIVGGGVEAGAVLVTIASDSTGVLTVDGTVTAANTSGDIAHDSADSGNPVKTGGKAYAFDGTATGTVVAENDRVNFVTDLYGRQFVEAVHPTFNSAGDNQSTAQTNTNLIATVPTFHICITDIIMSSDSAMNIKLVEDEGGTPVDVKGPYYFAANGGMAVSFTSPLKLTSGKSLGYTSSAAGNHTVEVHYFVTPA